MEDARIVKARLQKQNRVNTAKKSQPVAGRVRTNQEGEGEGDEEGGGEGKRLNKRVQWQLKCKEKRLRRNERKRAEMREGGRTRGKGDSGQRKAMRGGVADAEVTAKENVGRRSNRHMMGTDAQKTGSERGTGSQARRSGGKGGGGGEGGGGGGKMRSASRLEGGSLLARSRKRKSGPVSDNPGGAQLGEGGHYGSSPSKRPRRSEGRSITDQLDIKAPKPMGGKQSRRVCITCTIYCDSL